MKKSTGILVLSCMIAVLSAGCAGPAGEKTDSTSGPETAVLEKDAGARSFLTAEGLGETAFAGEGKLFSGETANPGFWKLTEKLTSGESDSRLFSFRISDISDTYKAGAACDPYITLVQTKGQRKDSRKPCGTLYFARPTSEDSSLPNELPVLEYFLRKAGPAYAPVQLNCFSPENDGRTGSAEDPAGGMETYFSARGFFPNLVSEGDEIWLVLELWDTGAENSRMRTVWKYSWSFDEEIEPAEKIPEDHEGDNEYYKAVYPGHWERTDIRYLGTAGEEKTAGRVRIRTDRIGSDGREMLFAFQDADREVRVRIPGQRLDDLYYAGDPFVREVSVFCSSPDDEVPGSVRCSFYLGDISFDADGNVGKAVPKHFFTQGWPQEELEGFSPHPHGETMSWRNDLQRGYLMLDGAFPEGRKDGEKLYVVYEAADTLTGENHLANIYEYTWHPGPETVWIYNPMMY